LFTIYLIDTPEQCSYSLFINSKEGANNMFTLTHKATGKQYGQFKTELNAWGKAMRLHQSKGLNGWLVAKV
jgi:hypothetical protein